MTTGSIGFVGSRNLSYTFKSLVSFCVSSALKSGLGVTSGCAAGADTFAILAASSANASTLLTIFTVSGFPTARHCVQTAYRSGASVSWWAGGGPSIPIRARFARRTHALIQFLSQAGSGSKLLAFVSGGIPSSPGSWLAIARALSSGVPVVVFPCGCSKTCLPSSLSGVGPVSWTPAWRPPCKDPVCGYSAAVSQASFL